jgi:hypothetical protein
MKTLLKLQQALMVLFLAGTATLFLAPAYAADAPEVTAGGVGHTDERLYRELRHLREVPP